MEKNDRVTGSRAETVAKPITMTGSRAPEEQSRSFANVFTRASAFFLVTSRRISRSTTVEIREGQTNERLREKEF
jgi:hypothetical protein